MEGTRPVSPEDLPQCERLLDTALRAVVRQRGGLRALADLARPGTGTDTHGAEGEARGRDIVESGAADGTLAATLLSTWTHGGTHRLLAGTVDGEIVGLAAGHCAPSGGDSVGVVDCVYVEAAARGVGVGTAMAEALLEWFGAQGCRGVDAPALPGDRESKQLFESLGLSARLLVLHRRLP
ncbi:MAG: GNAT family N-acetyltransferase [Acidimicrobiales bacterium]